MLLLPFLCYSTFYHKKIIKFNKTLPLYISSIEFLKMVFETPCSFVTLADVSHFAFLLVSFVPKQKMHEKIKMTRINQFL